MKVLFIAGFGPIATDIDDSRRLYGDALGITFRVEEDDYLHTEQVDGAKTFAVWPLAQAAESCFGTNQWPTDVAVPQAWLEFWSLAPPEPPTVVLPLPSSTWLETRSPTSSMVRWRIASCTCSRTPLMSRCASPRTC